MLYAPGAWTARVQTSHAGLLCFYCGPSESGRSGYCAPAHAHACRHVTSDGKLHFNMGLICAHSQGHLGHRSSYACRTAFIKQGCHTLTHTHGVRGLGTHGQECTLKHAWFNTCARYPRSLNPLLVVGPCRMHRSHAHVHPKPTSCICFFWAASFMSLKYLPTRASSWTGWHVLYGA